MNALLTLSIICPKNISAAIISLQGIEFISFSQDVKS